MAETDPKQSGEGTPPPDTPLAPIIVKKITVAGGGHHGGAWKVAYADFVTAMMAFFLLLWLLGATTEKQRKGLADYFTPTLVKLRQESAGADGMLGGSSIVDADNYPNRAGQTGTKSLTIPRDSSGGVKEGGAKVASPTERLKRLQEIAKRIEEKLAAKKGLARLSKQVRVVRDPQGVRIDLVDDADFSMFHLGSTMMTGEAQELVQIIAQAVKPEGRTLIVRGHTDALPWSNGRKGNNWALSAGRAESTRLALMRSGIRSNQFERIEGVADREPLIEDDPTDPRNRRISIVVVG